MAVCVVVMRAVTWRECWRGPGGAHGGGQGHRKCLWRWRGGVVQTGVGQSGALVFSSSLLSSSTPLCRPASRRVQLPSDGPEHPGRYLGIDTRVQESRSISGEKSQTFRWSLMLAEHKNWSCGLELPQSSITPSNLWNYRQLY